MKNTHRVRQIANYERDIRMRTGKDIQHQGLCTRIFKIAPDKLILKGFGLDELCGILFHSP